MQGTEERLKKKEQLWFLSGAHSLEDEADPWMMLGETSTRVEEVQGATRYTGEASQTLWSQWL